MPDKAWYKDWFSSPYYHLLYNNRDDKEAFYFIHTLIDHLQPGKGSRMLDVACGKGRHSKVLAQMEYDVTGIDISLPSIEEALKFEQENLHFYQHDMRLPLWINYFDYAFNFFTSFGYFRTKREHDDSLRSIAQSLRINGIFVIDYLNVRWAETSIKKSYNKEIGDVLFHISKWQDEDHFFKQIQVKEANSATFRHLNTERVAKFSLGDFTDMLAYQNMQVQEVFGDYQLNKYDIYNSPRLIIVARKER
jgi:SAM-dependent methyltransferase